MANYTSLNDYLRKYVDILAIAEYIGLPLRPGSTAGMYYIGNEKEPSLHITMKDGVQTFYYHGHTYPIDDYLTRAGKQAGQKSSGGNPIDFAVFAMQFVGKEPARIYDRSHPEEIAKGMTALTEFLKGITPSIHHLIPEPKRKSPSPTIHQAAPAPSPADLASVLSDYIIPSGGAFGADVFFGNELQRYGATVFHYYAEDTPPSRMPPYRNTPIPQEDINEGAVWAARAAKRMTGYAYERVKDRLIIRDYSQMKNADAVFAVGRLAEKGARFYPNKADDQRVCQVDTVTGGTGYCVNMAIIADKPVYVFNQEPCAKYPVGWYKYNKETDTYVQTELPVLVKKSACIGSRSLNEDGKKAIKALVENTVRHELALRQGNVQSVQAEPAPSQAPADDWRADIDDASVINIYAGTGDNPELSNFAYRPLFTDGHLFYSVEQYFQWKKASLCNDALSCAKILALSGEGVPAGMDKAEFNEAILLRKTFEGIPQDNITTLQSFVRTKLSPYCFKTGQSAVGYEGIKDIWESRARKEALAVGIHLSFLHNDWAQKLLLETGNSLLTHKGYGRSSWSEEVFPELLMRERHYLRRLNTPGIGGSSEKTLEITKSVRGISNYRLREYLAGRGFTAETIARSFYEVDYRWVHQDGKIVEGRTPFKAIATPGINGRSWSVVIPSLNQPKRSSGPQCVAMFDKDYNFVTAVAEGELPKPSSSTIYVFEGQMNAPSMLQLQGKTVPRQFDVMTLNSVENINAAIPILKQYRTVMLSLDVDNAGERGTEKIASALLGSGIRCFDVRPLLVGRQMMPLVPIPGVVVDVAGKQVAVPENKYDPTKHGATIRKTVIAGVQTKGSQGGGPTTLSAYWSPIIASTPAVNDYNDLLKATIRRTPPESLNTSVQQTSVSKQQKP